MPPPGLLLSNPPSLSEQLRHRTDRLRSRIIRTNYNTQFAQNAPELAGFRRETAGVVDRIGDDSLCESFRATVPFTSYDTYNPFIAKCLETPCKASTIVDLLVPGLPDYLVESSSTSGGRPKTFPKYNRITTIKSSDPGSWSISDPLRRRTKAYLSYLGSKPINVVDQDDSPVKALYLASMSVIRQRTRYSLDPEKDEERMGTFILDHAAPYAAAFVDKWRSFLLIHALFALGSRSLETMDMLFINTLVDVMCFLDAEYDMMVDCIANGTIPDLEGVGGIRHHLESNIVADPERAVELRRLGRPSSRLGWCSLVWPSLRSVTAIASGCFASSVPLAQRFLGPAVDILSLCYSSTESYIGHPYDPLNMNLYKPIVDTVFEFLDIGKIDSIGSLAQLWEVELSRRYELVFTTQDGLWRYRLGDVIEVAGFDPSDGTPIIQFVERRSVAIRFPDIAVTEEQLQAAASSMQIRYVNWTTTIDNRSMPNTIGFFVELAEDEDSELAHVPERVLDQLSQSNANIVWGLEYDMIRTPTVRLVRPRTFCDFLQLKLDEGSRNVGQIKVPSVLPKAAYVEWFSDQVVREL